MKNKNYNEILAEALAKQRRRELLNGWIPANEEKPPESGDYLVVAIPIGAEPRISVSHYSEDADIWTIKTTVAYWMPLPELPKEGEIC